MKSKIALLAMASSILALTSCNDYTTSGTLDITQPLNTGSTIVPPGVYSSEFEYDSDHEKIHIIIHPNTVANPSVSSDLTFAFHVPQGTDFDDGSQFLVKSAQIGVPEDVGGVLNSNDWSTPSTCSVSACTRQECATACDQNGKNCVTNCKTFPGRETVCSHEQGTSRQVDLNILVPGTQTEIARLQTSGTDASTVTDSDTGCL